MSQEEENIEVTTNNEPMEATPVVEQKPKIEKVQEPPKDMGNYMEMMQNMMQMYMSNPEMQSMMNSQMQQTMKGLPQQPPQVQVTKPKETEKYESFQSPEKQVQKKKKEEKPANKTENLAKRIDRMFQEEAEDLDDFYNHFEHSGRKSSYNQSSYQHSEQYEPAPRSSIYQDGPQYNPRYGQHLQDQFGPNHNISTNSGMMLEAESEFMPLRASHRSIDYEGDDRIDSPYKGPSKFAMEDKTTFRVSEDSPYKGNNRGSFRDSQRPSMAGRRHNTKRNELQNDMNYDLPNTSSFVNHEQNLAEDSQYDAFRRNSSGKKISSSPYKRFEEEVPITESRYSPNKEDDRPIKPGPPQNIYHDERPLNSSTAGGRNSRFNAQQDDRPIRENSTPEKDTPQYNSSNAREESPPYDPYQDREPIETNNSHDLQKVAGAKKSFEQLLEEQLKKEGAIYKPDKNPPPKVKKPFLKKGTRKVLSNGRVKSKPKKSSAASSVKRNNFVKKSPKKSEEKSKQKMRDSQEEEEDEFDIPKYNVSDFLKEDPSQPNSSSKKVNEDYDEIEDTVKLDKNGNPIDDNENEDEEDDQDDYDDEEEMKDPWGNDKKLANDIKNLYSEEKKNPKIEKNKFDDEKVWDDEEPIEEATQEQDNNPDDQESDDIEFSDKKPKKNKVVSKYFQKDTPKGQKNSQPVESIGYPKQQMNEEEIVNRYVNDKIVELNAQIDKFKKQNQKLKSQKHELDEEKRVFEKERANFEAYVEVEKDRIKEKWEEELKKIKREKKIAERNHKAMINKPNRKEREEIEALKASVLQLETDKRHKEKKLKFTVDRQKKQILELEKKSGQLQEEVLMYEQMRLRQDAPPSNTASNKTPKSKSKKSTQKPQVRRREVSSNDLRSRSGLDDDSEETDNFKKYENMVEEKNVYKKSPKKSSPKFVAEEVYGQVNPHEDSEEDGDDFQAIEDKLMNKNNNVSDEEFVEEEDTQKGPFKLDIDVEEYNFNSNTFYKKYIKERNIRLQVVDENISPNGKIQRTYANGKKEVIFGNGAKREVIITFS